MRALRGAEIALIPQEPMAAFSPVHTVGQQIIEAIMLHAQKALGRTVSRQQARAMTIELFRDVGISMPEQRVDAYSWQLSGGLRQRAMIAMALSCRPRLLIADEPTTAIDVTTQAQILALLRDLQRKYDTAIIFITHDLGVIAQMAHYVVVMYLGSVMEEGPVDDIFHTPKHPYTKALLRSIPSLYGETRIALPVIAGALPHPLNRPSGCPFHPRCDEVIPERCANAVPRLQPVGARQQVLSGPGLLHSKGPGPTSGRPRPVIPAIWASSGAICPTCQWSCVHSPLQTGCAPTTEAKEVCASRGQ